MKGFLTFFAGARHEHRRSVYHTLMVLTTSDRNSVMGNKVASHHPTDPLIAAYLTFNSYNSSAALLSR